MKVLIAILVMGVVLEFGDARRKDKASSVPPDAGGNGKPAPSAICDSIPQCPPSCVLDVSGPCPQCDCDNVCVVDCGPKCKVVRNGGQCSCVCNGNGDNPCVISCPPGCNVTTTNAQCSCICN
ncbi:hypothetical protein TNIN_157371 [Trichonephila inaurata madagascariensis]|uniref:Uncharacterized protein n=1 Tax=Trichonephila inaurata madagascariensis TaxID=2747483 RepID=A0A8X6X3J2_9ARAC|nr:hypothetical protein TNIN_157371 [Trichonephila inaurata madagascariensis]